MNAPAVFLDRDGVLVEDVGLITRAEELCVLPGVPAALRRLKEVGFRLVVITNQAVVARGLIGLNEVGAIHARMCMMLEAAGSPALDAIYACPHHPQADLAAYRVACDCRKPRPGLLLRAARELGIDLTASYMVGDRITDIVCGAHAGCRTILVRSPATAGPPIMTADPIDDSVRADYVCDNLQSAADWILSTP